MNKENLLEQLSDNQDFVSRHNGSDSSQISEMLVQLGVDHLETLITQTIPDDIRLPEELDLPKSLSEAQMLAELKQMAKQNQVKTSFIGQGYYNTYTPAPILRNVLENPGWYTAYTPYQPEISQGRLESLLNFQQMIIDLTGMTISNASLLDEATAAAEAMTLCFRNTKKKNAPFFVANDLHPQSIRVLETRAKFLGIELVIEEPNHFYETTAFGAIFQYPNTYGVVADMSALVKHAQQEKILTVFATDLLALTLLKPPGEFGADVVIGSAQRFGVPMGFGGPHAAFIATTDKLKRSLPGRVIGVSIDANGAPALRMAMQTREQHIRREKATSNICTAQALLANISAFYAIYHGPDGLKKIARRVHHFTRITAEILTQSGLLVTATNYFDTLTLDTGSQTQDLFEKAQAAGFNLRLLPNHLALSFDETTTLAQIQSIIHVLTGSEFDLTAISDRVALDEFSALPVVLRRQTPYLTHPVFHQYQSETLLMRYMKHLENKDFSLTHGMIPLGSCTMKLNAAAEMIPVTWEEFSGIHPFAPASQTQGYQAMISQLTQMLCTITGYDAISMQPNSGAQGEYAGLIAIQRYHQSRGQGHRNICLIPSSAHGTNPASAAMVSLSVVVVQCDKDGNIDINDLKSKIETHHENLSCMMITYPSTHGVFEANIRAVCDYVHQSGGQVYLDGANMNAQVGLTSPGFIGADVSHLNLHKTFCIPHGGGGPGMGPIGVKQHLAEFLPNHFESSDPFTVSAAPFGSASILPISWAYIRMMGSDGLTQATRLAILHANYMMQRLSPHYPILYRGENGRIAHECIIDIREIKEKIGITEEDIAKRLMDYGFHAPTMSFPVAGTLMIEPTESEDRDELDRFCDAMINIKKEINQVASGVWSLEDNPLVNAPHTQEDLMQEDWSHPYTRQLACYPAKNQQQHKYWPTVKRVNNVHGDRQLICSCPPPISDI